MGLLVMWGLYKSKNINVQYSSNFRNVCLTDGAMNVVILMHCEFCRAVIIPCPVFCTNFNIDLENQVFWDVVLCVDWWTNTSNVKECAVSIFRV
jgi:hypothetical protein